MAQKKKNLKQQKQKQKQNQKQTVIVNVLTSKKRRGTKRSKSSVSQQPAKQPLITTLPIQYTPYTMYDTSQLLTEANIRSLIATKAPTPLIEQNAIKNNINIDDLRKYRDKHYKTDNGGILVDAQTQIPIINDIMQNVEPIIKEEYKIPKKYKEYEEYEEYEVPEKYEEYEVPEEIKNYKTDKSSDVNHIILDDGRYFCLICNDKSIRNTWTTIRNHNLSKKHKENLERLK